MAFLERELWVSVKITQYGADTNEAVGGQDKDPNFQRLRVCQSRFEVLVQGDIGISLTRGCEEEIQEKIQCSLKPAFLKLANQKQETTHGSFSSCARITRLSFITCQGEKRHKEFEIFMINTDKV